MVLCRYEQEGFVNQTVLQREYEHISDGSLETEVSTATVSFIFVLGWGFFLFFFPVFLVSIRAVPKPTINAQLFETNITQRKSSLLPMVN